MSNPSPSDSAGDQEALLRTHRSKASNTVALLSGDNEKTLGSTTLECRIVSQETIRREVVCTRRGGETHPNLHVESPVPERSGIDTESDMGRVTKRSGALPGASRVRNRKRRQPWKMENQWPSPGCSSPRVEASLTTDARPQANFAKNC